MVTAGGNGTLHSSKLVSLLELTSTKLLLKKEKFSFVFRANDFLKMGHKLTRGIPQACEPCVLCS